MGGLGWPPDSFWSATPQDVRLALEGRKRASGAVEPLTRDELTDLMERYPDEPKKKRKREE